MDKPHLPRIAALLAAGGLCALPASALATPHRARTRPAHAHNRATQAHKRVTQRATTMLSSRHTKRGLVVTEANGIALYTFTGRSCTSTCQRVWHPLIARGRLLAARGSRLQPRLIGRARDGRAFQVTYDHHRLYTFAGDQKAGQISGEGKHQFGGYWYVVGVRGAILKPRYCGIVCNGY